MKTEGLPVGVVGAGSFGTTLAILLANAGCDVSLWGRSEDVVRTINEERENPLYLPDVRLPDNISATTDLEQSVAKKRIILGVTPSHVIREIFGTAAPFIDPQTIVVCASKGIEQSSLATVDQMLMETLPAVAPEHILVLSGPSFAVELARNVPTAVTLAGPDEQTARQVQSVLMQPHFRVYTSPDVVGVAVGGAIKNVIAIAVGIADGLNLGHNTRAGLITRGIRELTRLAVARGAHPITLSGLSGLGDLVLTCTGDLSRNRQLGLELGRGRTVQEIVDGMRMVAEGVKTSRSVIQMAEQYDVDAPICQEVYNVIYRDKPADEGARDLMHRPPRSEHEFDDDNPDT
ncbi:MAG: glycerol-3-phosphate dehydrogenase [Myxococcales bacterium]|nr:glycerol-3-phosphate dehydrogenase [Myxococcales bacterium]